MRKLNQREKVLLGVVAVVGVAYLMLRQDGLIRKDAGGASALAPISGEAPRVRMDLLALQAVDYDPNGRNLFQYYTPPPPPRRQVVRQPPPPPPPPPPQKPRQQPKPIARAPQPPEPDFAYLGFLGPKDDKIAFFGPKDTEQEMMMARVGDVLQGKFELLEFKYDGVVFGFTDERFRGQTTELKMEEQ